MDYATIFYSDSKMACAALFMALRMNGKSNVWDKTLQYYTSMFIYYFYIKLLLF